MTHNRFARMSDAEMERRWTAIRTLLEERGLDALITLASEDEAGGHVKWLTDAPVAPYRRGVVFDRTGLMAMVEHGGKGQHRVLDGADPYYRGIADVYGAAEFPAVNYSLHYEAEIVVDLVRKRGYGKVALVGTGNMPHRFVQYLHDGLEGQVVFCDETEAFDALMVIKSAEEQALLRRSAALQDHLFELALDMLKPGLRDVDITAAMRAEAQRHGSEGGIILAGSAPGDSFAPFQPIAKQNRVIEAGDVVSFLIENSGPGGYFTELARSVVVGKAGSRLKEAVAQAKELQDKIISRYVPGTACADIFAAHNADRAALGLPPEDRIFSHGQGYNLVERPLIREDEPMQIAAGMHFAIHPSIADPRAVFAIMCDNFIVEAEGVGARLHTTEQKLFEI